MVDSSGRFSAHFANHDGEVREGLQDARAATAGTGVEALEYQRLADGGQADAAPYALCLGYRIRFILDLNEEWGMTVLMIEHDMSVVMDISHRVMVLDFGRKIADGTPEAVLADPQVRRAYLGEGDEVNAEVAA
jgi:ABC-type histidine transport system ATPase subunit